MMLSRPVYVAAAAALAVALAAGIALMPLARAQSSPSSPVVTAVPSASAGTALPKGDVAFMKQAAQNGQLEVQGSQLALGKTSTAEVKAFAQQMVTDHTAAGDELKALAGAKGVKLSAEPSLMQKAKLKLLGARDGAGFDKHYVDDIGISAHQDTIKLFRKVAEQSGDADIKAFASKTLPTLEHHLSMARALKVQTDSRP
ncbi:MAG: DUF4142 domain-containing protein [Burkholderiales bacterium]